MATPFRQQRIPNNDIVADALVRYINQGITLGSVNMPEAQLRSLTLDEPNHARVCPTSSLPRCSALLTIFQVIYIHRNVPGVLRKGQLLIQAIISMVALLTPPSVNEILGDHNVDKQISDSRGDVSICRKGRFVFLILFFLTGLCRLPI